MFTRGYSRPRATAASTLFLVKREAQKGGQRTHQMQLDVLQGGLNSLCTRYIELSRYVLRPIANCHLKP